MKVQFLGILTQIVEHLPVLAGIAEPINVCLLPFKIKLMKSGAVHFCLAGCCSFLCQPMSEEYIAHKGQTCSSIIETP